MQKAKLQLQVSAFVPLTAKLLSYSPSSNSDSHIRQHVRPKDRVCVHAHEEQMNDEVPFTSRAGIISARTCVSFLLLSSFGNSKEFRPASCDCELSL